jgi:hypothetical protein
MDRARPHLHRERAWPRHPVLHDQLAQAGPRAARLVEARPHASMHGGRSRAARSRRQRPGDIPRLTHCATGCVVSKPRGRVLARCPGGVAG